MVKTYLESYRVPKINKRKKRRYRNENDPANKGQTGYQEDYGL